MSSYRQVDDLFADKNSQPRPDSSKGSYTNISYYWQVDDFRAVTSPLTSNTIHVNLDAERFLIMPEVTWNIGMLAESILTLRARGAWQRHTASSNHFRALIKPLMDQPSQNRLADFIDVAMSQREKWGVAVIAKDSKMAYAAARPWIYSDKTRISEVFVIFWKAGALAFPREPVTEFKGSRFTLSLPWDTLIQEEMRREGVRVKSTSLTDKVSELHDVLLTCCPIRQVGDLVPDVVNALPRRKPMLVRPALRALSKVIKDSYSDQPHSTDEYWPATQALQDDLEFAWVTALDPAMSGWAKLASQWLRDQGAAISTKHQTLRVFLKALLERPQLSRQPVELLQRTESGNLALGLEYLDANRMNCLVDFIDWVIDLDCSTRRDDGILVRKEGVGNPFEKKKNTRLAESVRNVMPPWLLKMLVECLVADDWSWAKTAMGHHTQVWKGDWFFKAQPDGAGAWTWCPARATALYTKLTFPSRQGQTRHLDSGEADAVIAKYDPGAPDGHHWSMVVNQDRVPSALAATKLTRHEEGQLDRRAQGAIQVAASESRNYLRLRFTTNKTADIGKDAWNRGYTSPWMPDDLATRLLWLRDWQRENNPVRMTTLWTDVDEFTAGDARKHHDVLRGMDSTFLFRDPTLDRPDHPVSNAKVRTLYGALCDEVERRCAGIGLTGADGKPIRLVATRGASDVPSGLVYPLHALRVSIVTHYVEEGGVSPEVMMKIVGHATVVMTMVYIKHSGEYIADAMMRGNEKLRENAQREWVTVARDKELDALRDMAFGASDVAYESLRSAPTGSVLPMNVGVCPTGGGRCHEGGARIIDRKSEDVYAPVQGGRSNCAGCRFLVTGEPWLEGVVSEFNIRSLDLSLKNQHLNRLDERLLPLDDERAECMAIGRLFQGVAEWSALTKEKEEIEFAQQQLHVELANLMVLDQQIRRLAKNRVEAGETRMALVVGDFASVETALQESCEFDLVDRICRSADIFPSLVARGTAVTTASMFRARAWDRVLRQNGLEPRFLDLSPEEGRHVGNRMTEWLDFRVGRPGTIALMDGSATVDEICRRTGLLSENFLGEIRRELDVSVPMRLDLRRTQARPAIGIASEAAE